MYFAKLVVVRLVALPTNVAAAEVVTAAVRLMSY